VKEYRELKSNGQLVNIGSKCGIRRTTLVNCKSESDQIRVYLSKKDEREGRNIIQSHP